MSAFGGKAVIRCGPIVHEIDPFLGRHKVDDGSVLRRGRLDFCSAVLVRFSERVFRAFDREQGPRLGKRDPSLLIQ